MWAGGRGIATFIGVDTRQSVRKGGLGLPYMEGITRTLKYGDVGPGEVAELEKCLLCKYQNLSQIPSKHVKVGHTGVCLHS